MNSLNFTLSEKHFICPSILNDSFSGQSNLGCRSLPFMTLNTSCQPLLACKVAFEKSADNLMGSPLQVTVSFSLAALKILSFYLILGIVIMMCLGVFLLGSSFFGTLLTYSFFSNKLVNLNLFLGFFISFLQLNSKFKVS